MSDSYSYLCIFSVSSKQRVPSKPKFLCWMRYFSKFWGVWVLYSNSQDHVSHSIVKKKLVEALIEQFWGDVKK